MAQIERNNKILKAKNDGITKIPEIDKAYNEAKTFVGFEPVYIAQKIITSALRENEKATQINYPAIKVQVLKNMNAILEPMMIKGFGYETNDTILTEVLNFHNDLNEGKKEMLSGGWILDYKKNHGVNGRMYYSFIRDDERFDIFNRLSL